MNTHYIHQYILNGLVSTPGIACINNNRHKCILVNAKRIYTRMYLYLPAGFKIHSQIFLVKTIHAQNYQHNVVREKFTFSFFFISFPFVFYPHFEHWLFFPFFFSLHIYLFDYLKLVLVSGIQKLFFFFSSWRLL